MKIIVSNGEIIDKLTILIIKGRCMNGEQLKNVNLELSAMSDAATRITNNLSDDKQSTFAHLISGLSQTNEMLWDIEDQLRQKEHDGIFDDEFINLARNVYKFNDRRSDIKKEINKLTGSAFIEEKSYKKYD